MGFPGGSACNAGDLGSIPGLGRSPGEGKGHPLQYSGLENSMDCIALGITESEATEQVSLSPQKGFKLPKVAALTPSSPECLSTRTFQ